ncbi:hypothetical protein [Azospirillum sp.]|uniref:hypothetical protein n=1 Tax=Azospirillum sp. TaxID=34012 RepID=UPI003D7148AC
MADDNDDIMTPEQAQRAIARAAQRTPQISAVRERIEKMTAEEKGLEMLAQAIRRLLHE